MLQFINAHMKEDKEFKVCSQEIIEKGNINKSKRDYFWLKTKLKNQSNLVTVTEFISPIDLDNGTEELYNYLYCLKEY